MKKYILLIILIIIPLNVNAGDGFNIICDEDTFKEFEEFTCRTSVSSSFEFNKIIFDIDLNGGLSLDEVRTNFTNLWSLTIDQNKVTAVTKNNVLVSNLQEFGILLLNGTEYGNKEIILKNITLINSKDNKTLEIEDASQGIKILSSENKLANIYINDKKISSFNSNVYIYKEVVQSDKIDITVDLLDKNSKVTGIGEVELEKNSYLTVVPIKVSSESDISRIYYLYLINEENHESDISADLIEIKLKKEVLDFKFNPNIYEYNIELDSMIQALELNIKLDDDLSLVKGYGNRTIKIEDGDNSIIIKIKNKDGEIQTYVINATKLLSNKSANFYLKSLKIDKYDLKFNKRVRNYNLAINKSIKKLNINAIPEDNKSSINIMGNEDLVDGSIIKIIVKAENESRYTYSIQINYKSPNYLNNLLLMILSGTLFLIIAQLFKKFNVLNKIKKIFSLGEFSNKKDLVEEESVLTKSKTSKKDIKAKETTKKKTVQKVKPPVSQQASKNKKSTSQKNGSKTKPTSKKYSKSTKTNPKKTTKTKPTAKANKNQVAKKNSNKTTLNKPKSQPKKVVNNNKGTTTKNKISK